MVISMRGLGAIKTTQVRTRLRKKNIKVTVVRNALFAKAVGESPMKAISGVLTGSSAVAYGGQSVVEVAREIIAIIKDFPEIELKGAVLDGQLFSGEEGCKRLSSFPTRDEAIAQDVALILSPGRKLVAQVKGPGGRLLGIVKSIQEKLEKGEAIAPVA
jgi:large subunit ribosomal protein L10